MFIIVLIAISLSMDAFSLALAYGTLNLNKKDILKIAITVGVYHFIMPLIGFFIGSFLLHHINLKPNLIVFLILFFIGIQMVYETFKEEEIEKIISLKEILLFGLAVSIDSFSVGIGLEVITQNYILAALTFSIFSFLFTYFGLNIGKRISNLIGKYSTIFGGLTLIIIGLIYFIK